jgi:hypothetical protein
MLIYADNIQPVLILVTRTAGSIMFAPNFRATPF